MPGVVPEGISGSRADGNPYAVKGSGKGTYGT